MAHTSFTKVPSTKLNHRYVKQGHRTTTRLLSSPKCSGQPQATCNCKTQIERAIWYLDAQGCDRCKCVTIAVATRATISTTRRKPVTTPCPLPRPCRCRDGYAGSWWRDTYGCEVCTCRRPIQTTNSPWYSTHSPHFDTTTRQISTRSSTSHVVTHFPPNRVTTSPFTGW